MVEYDVSSLDLNDLVDEYYLKKLIIDSLQCEMNKILSEIGARMAHDKLPKIKGENYSISYTPAKKYKVWDKNAYLNSLFDLKSLEKEHPEFLKDKEVKSIVRITFAKEKTNEPV